MVCHLREIHVDEICISLQHFPLPCLLHGPHGMLSHSYELYDWSSTFGSVSTSWASTSDGWTTFLPPRVPFYFAWHCASVQPVERVSCCVSMKMKGQTLCLVLNESRKVYLGVWFSVLASLCRSHTFTK